MMLLGGGTENDMHSSVFRNQVGWPASAARAVSSPLLSRPLYIVATVGCSTFCRCKTSASADCTHHAQVLTYDKAHTSTTQLFPSVARTAELVASQPGIWQYNCDVQDHLVAGITAPSCTSWHNAT